MTILNGSDPLPGAGHRDLADGGPAGRTAPARRDVGRSVERAAEREEGAAGAELTAEELEALIRLVRHLAVQVAGDDDPCERAFRRDLRLSARGRDARCTWPGSRRGAGCRSPGRRAACDQPHAARNARAVPAAAASRGVYPPARAASDRIGLGCRGEHTIRHPDGRHSRLGHRLPGRNDRERRDRDDRSRAADDVRRQGRGADVRQQRLPRRALGPPHPGRRHQRLLRAAPDVPHRPHRVRRCVGRLRPGPDDGAPHPRPPAPGCLRSAPRARKPVDHHRHLLRRGARPRDRPVGGRDLGDHDPRPVPRRVPRPVHQLARRLPHQRSARAPGAVRHARREGEPRRAGRWTLRLARRCRHRDRRRRPGVRCDPRRRAPVAGRRRLRRTRHRRGCDDRVPIPHADSLEPARARSACSHRATSPS